MYFYGKEDGKTMIECDKCGKVYVYDDKYFSKFNTNYCISNTIINCPSCGNHADANTKFYARNPVSISPVHSATNEIKCPKCGCNDCQPINESYTTGRGYGAGKGCCGYLLLGPIGLLCGACGSGSRTTNQLYWVCKKCGYKFKK